MHLILSRDAFTPHLQFYHRKSRKSVVFYKNSRQLKIQGIISRMTEPIGYSLENTFYVESWYGNENLNFWYSKARQAPPVAKWLNLV